MNIKSLSILAAGLTLCASSAFASPARDGIRHFSQPDGSTVSLRLVGDEFFHTYVTQDGFAVKKGPDGFFYYQSADGISNIRVGENASTPLSELQALSNTNVDKFTVKALVDSRKNEIVRKRARRSASSAKKASQVVSSGSPRIPVLLVEYSDYKFKDKDPDKTFVDFFSSGSKSVKQYFTDQSNGKYTPQFDVYGPVTLPHKRAYYGGNDELGYDLRVGQMVGDACNNLNSKINFADYDNDSDEECDVVIVLYAGDGEASSYDEDAEDAIWPCQWALKDSDYGKSLTLDGVKVNRFAVFNELNGYDLSRIDGIGTVCHEFSHCLDLPDFYDTQYGPHFGMGPWSVMDRGSYNDEGYTPIGYSAYEKNFMGWIDIEEGKENTLYNLPPLNQGDIATDKAVKLTNPADQDEYFILENRKKQGWDAYMPAEGLLIYHVTYSESAWVGNTVNDYDLQRMTPVPADNSLKLNKDTSYGETYYEIDYNDLLGDLWPYGSVTELTDTSKPASKVNKGSALGKPITEITRNSDGSISFWCMKDALPSLSTPTGLKHTVLDTISAEISWDASSDETPITYTLEIAPHKDVTYQLVLSTTFDTDAHGWETDGFTEVKDGAIRLGSSKQPGLIESPKFMMDSSGLVSVKVNAASYSSDKSKMCVELLDASYNTLEYKEIALTTDYADYEILLTGAPEEWAYLWIATDGRKKRFYVKSVDIYTGDAFSEAAQAKSARVNTPADDIITIEGITTNHYTVTGLQEGAKYDYRIRKVPVDSENWNPSPWTEKILLELDLSTGIILHPEYLDGIGSETRYYTIQGYLLPKRPTLPGIYIEKSSGKTRKVIIR